MRLRKPTDQVPAAAQAAIPLAAAIVGAAFILYWCAISLAELEFGLGFSLVWPIAGAILVACAANRSRVRAFFARPFFRKRAVRIPAAAFAALFLAISLVFFARIVSCPRPLSIDGMPDPAVSGTAPAYAVVLGGGIHRDGTPSVSLIRRLEAASAYARDNPGSTLVVTGGRLPREPEPEADSMARWLVANEGIADSRIIREREARDTIQNFTYSLAMIESVASANAAAGTGSGTAALGQAPAIAVVTSDYHMNRSLFLARRAGCAAVVPVSAPSPALMAPNNYLRETGAWWKLSIRLALAGDWASIADLVGGR